MGVFSEKLQENLLRDVLDGCGRVALRPGAGNSPHHAENDGGMPIHEAVPRFGIAVQATMKQIIHQYAPQRRQTAYAPSTGRAPPTPLRKPRLPARESSPIFREGGGMSGHAAPYTNRRREDTVAWV